jgi:hypothetical protein
MKPAGLKSAGFTTQRPRAARGVLFHPLRSRVQTQLIHHVRGCQQDGEEDIAESSFRVAMRRMSKPSRSAAAQRFPLPTLPISDCAVSRCLRSVGNVSSA